MLSVPTYAYLFLFAVIAAIAGRVVSGRVGDDPGSLPGWILYAVAVACVVIGIAVWWLDRQ